MLDLTPDISDRWPEQTRLIPQTFIQYGAQSIFYGEIVTVKCFEDNSRVKELLATPGHGKVLVVDGGGSRRKALMGDLIAESAVKSGWAGVVIYGVIRDAGTISTLDLGVQALGTVPIKTERKGVGDVNVNIDIAGVTLSPGMYLYADSNGILVTQDELDLNELDLTS